MCRRMRIAVCVLLDCFDASRAVHCLPLSLTPQYVHWLQPITFPIHLQDDHVLDVCRWQRRMELLRVL